MPFPPSHSIWALSAGAGPFLPRGLPFRAAVLMNAIIKRKSEKSRKYHTGQEYFYIMPFGAAFCHSGQAPARLLATAPGPRAFPVRRLAGPFLFAQAGQPRHRNCRSWPALTLNFNNAEGRLVYKKASPIVQKQGEAGAGDWMGLREQHGGAVQRQRAAPQAFHREIKGQDI